MSAYNVNGKYKTKLYNEIAYQARFSSDAPGIIYAMLVLQQVDCILKACIHTFDGSSIAYIVDMDVATIARFNQDAVSWNHCNNVFLHRPQLVAALAPRGITNLRCTEQVYEKFGHSIPKDHVPYPVFKIVYGAIVSAKQAVRLHILLSTFELPYDVLEKIAHDRNDVIVHSCASCASCGPFKLQYKMLFNASSYKRYWRVVDKSHCDDVYGWKDFDL